MKIWYPLNFAESKCKTVPDYLLKCQLGLYTFRLCLRHNLNNLKWTALTDKLKEVETINFTKDIKAITIANQYMSSLQCSYDLTTSKCYFYVPDNIRCIGTTNQLNYVIRLIEYGTDQIPPMNWIRHSYIQYYNSVVEEVQQ